MLTSGGFGFEALLPLLYAPSYQAEALARMP
jgi:hypothetical protein